MGIYEENEIIIKFCRFYRLIVLLTGSFIIEYI